MRSAVLLALVLLTPLPLAFADPGGSDAPNRREDALDVAPGTYAGTYDPAGPAGDADWYRVSHPAGKGVRAVLVVPNASGLIAYSDAGGMIAFSSLVVDPSTGLVTGRQAIASDPDAGAVRLQVVMRANYTLTIEIVDVADVAVVDLKVEDDPSCVADFLLPCADHPFDHRITVTLRNHGALPYNGTLRAETHTLLRAAQLGEIGIRLPAGGTVAVTFFAEGVAIGNVTYAASVTQHAGTAPSERDANGANNGMRVERRYFVDGPGVFLL